MSIFTFHFAKTGWGTSLAALAKPPTRGTVPGLHHAECMTRMTLGAPIVSPQRMQPGSLTLFAAWESAEAIDSFLDGSKLGQALSGGWHVRMEFLRRWGSVREVDAWTEGEHEGDPVAPVVAFTLARMKLPEVPRFIRWGKPVEELVRDHPGQTMAIAAVRLPRTVATFSIWKTQQEMAGMVRGHSHMPRPERHAKAMQERTRRDFHFEFTTLRFRPLSEHGTWEGRPNLIPGLG